MKTKQHRQILDKYFNHPYSCDCRGCLMCWALLGPDGGDPGEYGPFTTEQVNEMQIQMRLNLTK